MTDNRQKALVILEADRTSDAAAATRHGIARKEIVAWRKSLATDPDLAAALEEETARAHEAYRDDLTATLQLGLARLRELLPQCEVADLPMLLDACRELGAIAVQSDALLQRRKRKEAAK